MTICNMTIEGGARAGLIEPDQKIFDYLQGKPKSPINKNWDKAMEYSVPRNFRFHDLRHTFASWARMDDADSADICAALDHSNIANTMPYAHIDPADHATTFNRISGQVVHNR